MMFARLVMVYNMNDLSMFRGLLVHRAFVD